MNREKKSPGGRLQVAVPNVTYRHVRCRPDEAEDEIWVEVRLDAEWVAACLIQPDAGQPVIAEVRVVPYEDDPELSALLGPGESRGHAPAGGVPLEKLRRLRSDAVLEAVRNQLEEFPPDAEYLGDVFAEFGFDRD